MRANELIRTCGYPYTTYRDIPNNCLIDPNGKIYYTSFTHHRKTAEYIVKDKWADDFKNSHINRGYDELEFLIIVKGFISINNGYVRWYKLTSDKQRKIFRDADAKIPELR